MSKKRDRFTNAAMKAFNQPTFRFPPCLPGQSGWIVNGQHYPCQKPEGLSYAEGTRIYNRGVISELLDLQKQMNLILEEAMKVMDR